MFEDDTGTLYKIYAASQERNSCWSLPFSAQREKIPGKGGGGGKNWRRSRRENGDGDTNLP